MTTLTDLVRFHLAHTFARAGLAAPRFSRRALARALVEAEQSRGQPDNAGQFGPGGGGGGKKAPTPKTDSPKRIFQRGEEIADSHHKAMRSVLGGVQSGKLTPGRAADRLETLADRAVSANQKNYAHRYALFREKMRAAYGDAALESPEWGKVRDAYKAARDATDDKIGDMAQSARNSLARHAREGKMPPHAAADLAEHHDELAQLYVDKAAKTSEAMGAFMAAHKPLHESRGPLPEAEQSRGQPDNAGQFGPGGGGKGEPPTHHDGRKLSAAGREKAARNLAGRAEVEKRNAAGRAEVEKRNAAARAEREKKKADRAGRRAARKKERQADHERAHSAWEDAHSEWEDAAAAHGEWAKEHAGWEKEAAELTAAHEEQSAAWKARQAARDARREKLTAAADLPELAAPDAAGAAEAASARMADILDRAKAAGLDDPKLTSAAEKASAAVAKAADRCLAAEKVRDATQAALDEASASEPPEPDAPDYPGPTLPRPPRTDYPNDEAGRLAWQSAWSEASGRELQLQVDWEADHPEETAAYEAESAKFDKAHDKWEAAHDKWEAKLDRFDAKASAAEEKLDEADDALGEVWEEQVGGVEEMLREASEGAESDLDGAEADDDEPEEPDLPDEPEEPDEPGPEPEPPEEPPAPGPRPKKPGGDSGGAAGR